MLELDAEVDASVELAERKIKPLDECGFADTVEVRFEPGLLDDCDVAEARNLLVDRELLDDSIPKVAASEVKVKLNSNVQSRRSYILGKDPFEDDASNIPFLQAPAWASGQNSSFTEDGKNRGYNGELLSRVSYLAP